MTDTANHELLSAFRDISAARVLVVGCNGVENALQRQVVLHERVRAHEHLVLFLEATECIDLGDSLDRAELWCHEPILQDPEFRGINA